MCTQIKSLESQVEHLEGCAAEVVEAKRLMEAAQQERDKAQAESARDQNMLHNLEHRIAQVRSLTRACIRFCKWACHEELAQRVQM